MHTALASLSLKSFRTCHDLCVAVAGRLLGGGQVLDTGPTTNEEWNDAIEDTVMLRHFTFSPAVHARD